MTPPTFLANRLRPRGRGGLVGPCIHTVSNALPSAVPPCYFTPSHRSETSGTSPGRREIVADAGSAGGHWLNVGHTRLTVPGWLGELVSGERCSLWVAAE